MKIIIEVVGSIIRVEIDGEEIAAASQGEAAAPSDDRVNPRRSGSDGASAGGIDVDRSAPRAPVEAGAEPTSLAGGLKSGIDQNVVDGTTSGPDAKRAPDPLHSAVEAALYLRPNCQKPGRDDCGGHGRVHCHSCNLTAATMEDA